MKLLFSLLFSLGLQSNAFAAVKLRSFDSKFLTSILNVQMQPEAPHSNDQITLFLNIDTDFSSSEEMNTILEAKLDGLSIGLLNPTTGLWIAALESATVGNHFLSVSYYLEDKAQAEVIRANLSQIEQDIAILDGQISMEEDAGNLAVLQAARAAKVSDQTSALSSLSALKTLVTTESFNFIVQ
ncbi:hypothetical protein [Bdellovibrio sp. NC01]|uniref:hypothetical protein n=1 Tax=Bdellovibrio sp. NC01 TaxID=2220073 RepID=UPI001159F4A0|nr:hypothetical protein [Bdellovibrio sp. NC01]QDK37929.1 hypothetical protein DOE51_10200 [Bdellovibrio sp. NC01]